MKVTLLGGGGFRTPLMFVTLRRAASSLDIHELVLHDIDAGRLRRMCQVLDGLQAESAGPRLEVRPTTELSDALRGAAFVLCAIRVGGLHARVVDERVPLGHGVVGQETVGPGGLNLVLRSVPVMTAIAERVAREAPDAWFINFTNPVGVMSSVVREVLGDRVLGVCDTPIALGRRVAALLGFPNYPAELRFDYFGLNHLGWLRSVQDAKNHDLLPALLADDAVLAKLEEGRLFGAELLRKLRMLPSEYLTYYYFPQRQLQAVSAAGRSRAEYLLVQQQQFYAAEHGAPADAVRTWRTIRAERERSYMAEALPPVTSDDDLRWSHRLADDDCEGYAGVAVAVLESLATGARLDAIINVPNRGSLPFLAADATVELPCTIDARGAVACAVDEVPEHSRVLMQRVHAAEQAAVLASRTASRRAAIEALVLHPLVDSTELAERIFSGYLQHQPELAAQFA